MEHEPAEGMDEVAGALERPADTHIRITSSGAETTVRIPRPRMPWILYAAIGFYTLALAVAFAFGFILLVLRRPFPGYSLMLGEYHRFPLTWELFALSGWMVAMIIGAVNIAMAARPLTRREWIIFRPSEIVIREETFGRARERSVPLDRAGSFRDRRDPQGLMESELVLMLQPSQSDADGAEIALAKSTDEAEKQWLTSVLNVFLSLSRRR